METNMTKHLIEKSFCCAAQFTSCLKKRQKKTCSGSSSKLSANIIHNVNMTATHSLLVFKKLWGLSQRRIRQLTHHIARDSC